MTDIPYNIHINVTSNFGYTPSKVTCRTAVGYHIGWQLLSQKLSTNGIECDHIQPFVLTNPNCYIKAVRIMAQRRINNN